MRSTSVRIVLAVAVLASARMALAQTADDIVEKTLTAQGGRAAMEKISSRSMKGTIAMTSPAGDLPGTIEVLNQAPNKVRTLLNLDLTAAGAGTVTVDQRFDGTNAYATNSMQGDTQVTGDRLETLRNNAFPSPFLGYKDRGTKIVLAGKEKVGDKDAYVLSVTPPTGPASRVWIDAESYLPVKTSTTIDTPETGPLEQTIEFADYRDVDGVKVPFKLSATTAVQSYTVKVTSVEHNVKIDPALFAKPVAK
jgi:photosynthetic reaction center cytochrome c subunit